MDHVTPISAEMLAGFEQAFESNPNLRILGNAISRTTLDDAAFVPAGAAKLRMDFSLEVPTTGITNQKQSGRCWMFSGLNLLRERVVKKCHMKEFAISGTYLAFYDKIEKCNNFFEGILYYADQELDDRETAMLMATPLPDGGQFDMLVALIRKYGAVPDWVMPETVHSTGTAVYRPLVERKMREDAIELRELKRAGKDTSARRLEMMQELYNAIRILYGEPPRTFDFDYTDDDKQFHSYPNMTPAQFRDEFIGTDFDDYAIMFSSPIHEMGKTYTYGFSGDVVENNPKWLNIPQEQLEELVIKQLKSGEQVVFACDCHPDRDRARGWWDPDTFDYGSVLGGLKFGMTKGQRLASGESNMNHGMLFCGVNITADGTPNRWKIENSWGDGAGQKGYFIGSEKWFKQNVYQATIRKSMLTEEQKKLFEQEPILMKLWDPLA